MACPVFQLTGALLIYFHSVFKKPLGLFSKEPMSGFYRNGYCDVGPDDTGNHSVAGSSSSFAFLNTPQLTSLTSNTYRPLSRLHRFTRQQSTLHRPNSRLQMVSLRRALERSTRPRQFQPAERSSRGERGSQSSFACHE
jgi:Uncharacterized protein conserved in bacteria (DUF2237)